MNRYQNYKTKIKGLNIHFLHINPNSNNRPVLMLHGWPGSFIEFYKIIPLMQAKGMTMIIPSLPGYGFSKMSLDKKKNLDILLDNYFSLRQSLCAAIIFMDIRHPLKNSDIQMMEFCDKYEVPFISVLTKSDKVSSSAISKAIKDVEGKLDSQSVIVTSSKNDEGFDKLSKKIIKFVE